MIRFAAAACAAATCLLLATGTACRRRRRTRARFRCNSKSGPKGRRRPAATNAAPGFPPPARSPPIRRATSRPSPRSQQARRRDHRARFRRRLGARRARARPRDPPARHDHDGRQDHRSAGHGRRQAARAARSRNAYCESMCAFVLLAGVERHVPAEARVMVHQIWLGDRRDDPTAANYSAEDLVLVQRDIGRLAQYTVEMGGGDRPARDRAEDSAVGADAAAVARRIARHEGRHRRCDVAEVNSGARPVRLRSPTARALRSTAAAGPCSPSDRARPTLGRSHPLTVEGDEIGTFELQPAPAASRPRLHAHLYRAAPRRSTTGARPRR